MTSPAAIISLLLLFVVNASCSKEPSSYGDAKELKSDVVHVTELANLYRTLRP